MGDSSRTLDYWRKFFRTANSDIFELIENAILVAAVDCSEEFKDRRGQIAEKLFASRFSRCSGCNCIELQVPDNVEGAREEEEGRSVKRELIKCEVSNYSYDEAVALSDEIEEENQIVGEVLRLKEVLCNKQEESDAVLLESLRRLQLMQLSVENLKATEIGRAVNGLRKHKSKQIRNFVRTLIDGWKVLVDEWVKATSAITDHSPASVNLSMVDEEEGLPSPPMDEGALFATQTTSIQLSEFFDGMDEDGNFNNIRDTGRVIPESQGSVKRQEAPVMQSRPQAFVNKTSKADFGTGRPLKQASEQKTSCELPVGQRKPSNTAQDKSKHFDEASTMAKLENAKRKLQEGYRQAEIAKKQRTIQIMELNDLPIQSYKEGRSNMKKPRNQSRNWSNSMR